MKKLTAIVCLLALTVSLLAGCGSAAPVETTAAPETAAAPETTAPETTAPETTEAPAPVEVRLGAMTGPTGIGMV